MKRRELLGLAVGLGAGAAACTEPTPSVPTTTAVPSPQTSTASPEKTASPADVPPVTDGDVTQVTVHGVLILIKRIPGAELVAAHLYIRGGVRNWSANNAGVEQLATSVAASGGTTKLDRDAFARKLASMGSDISGSSGNDYCVFAMKSLLASFDTTFEMLTDTLLSPALPPTEIELQRQAMLSRLSHEEESPDGRIGLLVHRKLYKNHPYENRPVGTIASVSKLTVEDLKAHLETLRQTSRFLLVVAGDAEPSKVADLVRATLGKLPRGNYEEAPLPGLTFAKSTVDVEPAKLPTNYVQGVFSTPGWKDKEFYAGMIAMEHLGFRVFEEVRTKRNLSYAPHASFRWASGIPIGQLYVSAVDPNTTIKVMFDEIAKLKNEALTPKQIAAAKSTFLTGHLMSSETTDGAASWLARAQIYAGDWRFEKGLLENVQKVSLEEVKGFANKHLQHIQFQILGGAEIDKKLFGSV